MSEQATEKERFLESIKEPEYVVVTDEMVAAGVRALRDFLFGDDLKDVVWDIYTAMEYERRSRRAI
jgi:hypothetical protein